MRCLVTAKGSEPCSCGVGVGGPPGQSPAGRDVRGRLGTSWGAQPSRHRWCNERIGQKMLPLQERKPFCRGPSSTLKAAGSVFLPVSCAFKRFGWQCSRGPRFCVGMRRLLGPCVGRACGGQERGSARAPGRQAVGIP